MGSVTGPLEPETRALLEEMAGEFHQRFLERVARRRPGMTEADRRALAGRPDRRRPPRSGCTWSIAWDPSTTRSTRQRASPGWPTPRSCSITGPDTARSLYAISPSPPRLSEAIPSAIPGLDRTKLPTFLYLWQPDPTVPRTPPH